MAVRTYVNNDPGPLDIDARRFLFSSGLVGRTTIKTAINNFVSGSKTDGFWSKMEIIYPFVGGASDYHKWNLKDPRDSDIARRMGWIGTPTHDSLGVTFNGLNNYATTQLLPTNMATGQGRSIGFYSQTDVANSNSIDCGSNGASNTQFLLSSRRAENIAAVAISYPTANFSQQFDTAANPTPGTGLWVGNRNQSDTTSALYRNGVQLTPTTNLTSLPGTEGTYAIFLGARNNVGVATNFTARTYSFFYVGYGLTTTDLTNLYTRVQAMQTTLGRQV